MSSFCVCVPKMIIIWCTVPEIRSETQHFLQFWAIFCSFTPPPRPPSPVPPSLIISKIKIFQKNEKKAWRYLNEDHMIYSSWNKTCHRKKFFFILGHFLPCQPLDNMETQNFKIKKKQKKKNSWRYYHFTHLHHKWKSYDVWFLRYGAWRTEFFVILDRFLSFYSLTTQKNQNFEKEKKKKK